MNYKQKAEAALRERAEIFEKRKALFDSDATDAEKREQAERMDADMDRLAGEAREAVEAGEREADLRSLSDRAGALSDLRTPDSGQRGAEGSDEFLEGFRAVARGDVRSFDFTASHAAFEGRAISMVSDGTGDNQNGPAGVVTPDTFVATLLQSLEDTSEILNRVRKISTSGGEVMTLPRRTGKVGGTFKQVLEAAGYEVATDGTFTPVNVSAHKFGAIAEVSEESMTDPALNILGIVAEEMGEDLAEDLAAEILNGTLLSESILGGAAVNSDLGPFGTVDGATYDALIALQHALRNKYRRNATWTVSDEFALSLRQVKDGNQNYIWQPAVVAGQPDLLLGKPVASEVNMPAPALGAVGALYGDLNRFYTLRNVRDISVTRSDEYGFDRDTVALKIKWRGDGFVYDPQALAFGNFAAV